MKKNFIIDFDSTFIKVESLDELAKISLNNSKKDINKIEKITKMGMEGKISFKKSLAERIHLLKAKKKHIGILIKYLKKNISESFLRNKNFIKKHRNNIFIVSGGFFECIYPIVSDFGIKKSNIYANNFLFDKNENIIGLNKNNLLSNKKGKVFTVKKLNLEGKIFVIGDGYTDYEIKKAGYANSFCVFTENIKRKNIIDKSDFLLKSLDDFMKIINDD